MDRGGVEEGNLRVTLPDQHADLGAPQHDPLGAALDQRVDDLQIPAARLAAGDSQAELPVDDIVHQGEIRFLGDQHREPVQRLETPAIEVLLHGVAGSEQTDGVDPGRPHRTGGGVGDVKDLHTGRGFHFGRHPMHGVGADHHQVGAPVPYPPGCVDHHFGGSFPIVAALQLLHLGEVDRDEHQPGRVEAAQSLLDPFVDEPVVEGG